MKNKLKSILIGSVRLSDAAILTLKKNTNLILIITKKNDGYNSDFLDIKKKYKNIEVIATKNINSSKIKNKIKELKPDIGFCVGWNQIINKKIFEIPKKGLIGHHPTLLPFNRGKHPIVWAIFLGLKETGSTFFKIDKGIDSGSIINQKKIFLKKNEDAGSLYRKIENIISIQIKEIIYQVKENSLKFKKKKLFKGNYWRKRDDLDSKIDFRMNSYSINKMIRSLTHPYVGAHILIKNKKYHIFKSKIINAKKNLNNIEPGKVIKQDKKSLTVKTYDGIIKLFSTNLRKKIKYLK